MTNALRTTGSPKVPLIATICSFVTNAFFNYVFIFGKFGAPALGVVGAAVATLIARVVEVGVLLVWYFHTVDQSDYQLVAIGIIISKGLWMNYWITTYPVIINETFWALGQVFYNAAYAMVGTQATAAIQVAVAVQNLSFILVEVLEVVVVLCLEIESDVMKSNKRKRRQTLCYNFTCCWSGHWWYPKPNTTLDTIDVCSS